MNKSQLIEEARRQSEALKRLSAWRAWAFAFSAVGIFLAYLGFSRTGNIVLGLFGTLIMILGIAAAGVINQGIRNGSRNVNRILDAAQKE